MTRNRENRFIALAVPRFLPVICAMGLVLAGVSMLALRSPGPASAQTIADSFGGFSKKNDQPINIEADTLEVLDDKNIAIFSGNVKATQGTFVLISKQLKVTYSRGKNTKGQKTKTPKAEAPKAEAKGIKYIDATGKVAISTPDNQSATSDWAKFDVLDKVITIGGNVVLSQAGNVMRGNKLVIDLKTGRSKFHATSKSADGKKAKRPRITGVFLPGNNKGKNPLGTSKKNKPAKSKKAQTASNPPLPWQKKQ